MAPTAGTVIRTLLAATISMSTGMPGVAHSADDGPGFNCSNPHSSVESAVFGDAELGRLYGRNRETYERLQADPVAFDIMLGAIRARQACIRWKVGEPYKACLMLVERVARTAYVRLELRQSRGERGPTTTQRKTPD